MSAAASYILSVTAAAILAVVIRELAGKGTMGRLAGVLAGLFVAVTVIAPLIKIELPDPKQWMADFRDAGLASAAEGAAMANDAQQQIIKTRLEAYVLDKAADYGAAPEVDIHLDDTGLPDRITLRCSLSPAVKAKLMRLIENDLGLGEEAQHWIG